jgi:hypothetical protein
MNTFKDWFEEHLLDKAVDIAENGANKGYPYISYISNTVELFDSYSEDIWNLILQAYLQQDYQNVARMIGDYAGSGMLVTLPLFKHSVVLLACEIVAREIIESPEELEED